MGDGEKEENAQDKEMRGKKKIKREWKAERKVDEERSGIESKKR